MNYDFNDCYWLKQDGNLYSTAQSGEVLEDNEQYQTWLAAGNKPLSYPTDAEGNDCREAFAKLLATDGIRAYPLTEAEINRKRMDEIEERLLELDVERSRPVAEITLALLNDSTDTDAVLFAENKLASIEEERAALAAELTELKPKPEAEVEIENTGGLNE